MSLWDALRMNMMISYQELVRTFLSSYYVSITPHSNSNIIFLTVDHGFVNWTPSSSALITNNFTISNSLHYDIGNTCF